MSPADTARKAVSLTFAVILFPLIFVAAICLAALASACEPEEF